MSLSDARLAVVYDVDNPDGPDHVSGPGDAGACGGPAGWRRPLLAENPHARRVQTWNANENRWMLAINDALGFAPIGLEGLGQKKV